MELVAHGKSYEITIKGVRREAREGAPRGATIEIRSAEGWVEVVEHVETDAGFQFFLDAASERRDELRAVIDELPPLESYY